MSEQYSFVEQDNEDYTAVRIGGGNYSGVILVYGTVGFRELPDTSEEKCVTFDFQVLQNPRKIALEDDSFVNTIGEILIDIMETCMDERNSGSIVFVDSQEKA